MGPECCSFQGMCKVCARWVRSIGHPLPDLVQLLGFGVWGHTGGTLRMLLISTILVTL